ncbi:hypothetical protein NDR87_10770 [Nocardia sp. CDC159]|uniref:HTH cro/C1-type domain-containing protein n=1 Tax=Nocardia pulmonis TaxID=2951408 RepID=A0A9X2E9E9_9NOCA|nr:MULTISPECIES: hypothetical protein [Nocardia]MCM6773953.1 hypothetical protein [Nocardia pulmonis]MCM6786840.1 hypothetical protein [Nocardia sp. CDC159]
MSDQGPQPISGLTDKLNALIEEHYARAGRRVPGVKAIANEIREATGLQISAVTLHKLRTGEHTNPTGERLKALAAFFGKPPAFFLDEDATSADLDFAAVLRERGVRTIAMRSVGLSKRSREAILDLIDKLHEIERDAGTEPDGRIPPPRNDP